MDRMPANLLLEILELLTVNKTPNDLYVCTKYVHELPRRVPR